jgi:hypothetical protein
MDWASHQAFLHEHFESRVRLKAAVESGIGREQETKASLQACDISATLDK